MNEYITTVHVNIVPYHNPNQPYMFLISSAAREDPAGRWVTKLTGSLSTPFFKNAETV